MGLIVCSVSCVGSVYCGCGGALMVACASCGRKDLVGSRCRVYVVFKGLVVYRLCWQGVNNADVL